MTASVPIKRSKTHKILKERFLIRRNRTKRANFRGSHLFQATYNKVKQLNRLILCQFDARRLAGGKGHHGQYSLTWSLLHSFTQMTLAYLWTSSLLHLKPGVGQYIATHATLAARGFFLANFNLPVCLPAFFQNLCWAFPVLAVANTASCLCPQNKIGHPAHRDNWACFHVECLRNMNRLQSGFFSFFLSFSWIKKKSVPKL